MPTISERKLGGWLILFQLQERTDVRMPTIEQEHFALQERLENLHLKVEVFLIQGNRREVLVFDLRTRRSRPVKPNKMKANIHKTPLQKHNSDQSHLPVLTSPIFAPVLGSSRQTLPSLPAVHTSNASPSDVLLIAFKQVTSVLTLRIELMGAPFKASGSSSRRLSSEEIAARPAATGTMS